MINILKLRKIEKEKKQQEQSDSLEQKPEEQAVKESAVKEREIENIDERIISEISEEINSIPDSLVEDFSNPSEVLLNVSQEIEEVEGSLEIQQFTNPIESEATEDVADPWITEFKDEPFEKKIPEGEMDPAEAFRQALIAEVLRDESMVTRAQVEEEESKSKMNAEAPVAKETKTENEGIKAEIRNTASDALKPEEKKPEEKKPELKKVAVSKPEASKLPEAKAQEMKVQQETKLQEAKAHEAIVQLVGFNLGKECYGVDIKRIKEINRMTEITRVPRAPEFIEGVINLRGSVIPVINLRKKVKMPSREYDKDTRIIIVELSGKTLGFIVDAVKEVLRIPESLLVPPPPLAVGKNADYITAVAKVEDELVILLDPDKVLSREETQKLEEAEGKKRK